MKWGENLFRWRSRGSQYCSFSIPDKKVILCLYFMIRKKLKNVIPYTFEKNFIKIYIVISQVYTEKKVFEKLPYF